MRYLILIIFMPNIFFSQVSEKNFKSLELKVFNDLTEMKCDGELTMHSYVAGRKVFVMDKRYHDGLSFYSLYSFYGKSLSIGIYEKEKGFRIIYPDSYVFDMIIKNGKLIERHQENNTFFLVYKYNESIFLLNSYEHKGNSFYLIDSYCISE